jgi:hypothetical protein
MNVIVDAADLDNISFLAGNNPGYVAPSCLTYRVIEMPFPEFSAEDEVINEAVVGTRR